MNVIEAGGLGKSHGATWALRDCTLTIPAGHVAALVSPNGAGKTTLLNLAVGLSVPNAGIVSVLGGSSIALDVDFALGRSSSPGRHGPLVGVQRSLSSTDDGRPRFGNILSFSGLAVRLEELVRRKRMKYVMLIYQGATPFPGSEGWAALSGEEQEQIRADYGSLLQTPGVTAGVPLGLPENATAVRVEGGKTLTTDGPFVGMKEAIGGWFVFEADDLDAAIEVAARVPQARLGGGVEIRPSEVFWR